MGLMNITLPVFPFIAISSLISSVICSSCQQPPIYEFKCPNRLLLQSDTRKSKISLAVAHPSPPRFRCYCPDTIALSKFIAPNTRSNSRRRHKRNNEVHFSDAIHQITRFKIPSPSATELMEFLLACNGGLAPLKRTLGCLWLRRYGISLS